MQNVPIKIIVLKLEANKIEIIKIKMKIDTKSVAVETSSC